MQERIERPMLYSTDMVKAILEERKNKTRRMTGLQEINAAPDEWKLFAVGKGQALGKGMVTMAGFESPTKGGFIPCPYGKPGDVLWVRETFADEKYFNGLTEECFPIFKTDYVGPVAWNWKPSIHMPKDYARIWLRIMDIRVERLQDITEDDAIAEGVIEYEDGTYHNYFTQKGLRHKDGVEILLAKGSFQSLWASINGQNSWDFNPWVWVLSFHVLSTTGRPAELEGKEVSHV